MTPKLYYMEWKDHWTQSTEWHEEHPPFSVPVVCTVGWLIAENKDVYVLTPNIDLTAKPPAWKGTTGILKAAVVKKRRLK